MSDNKIYNVKNRSAGLVVYKISETGARREFNPGETKKIGYEELLQLSYQPGGRELMAEYLQIKDTGVLESFNIQTEPEYNMSEEDIVKLIQTGSLDAWKDALDFAPAGVIDLIKEFSVKLPLTDYNKRKAMKDMLGFDIDAAIAFSAPETPEENAASAPTRRVQPESEKPETGRRTTAQYKIIDEE
jgi:hypothetical protein